MRWHSSNWPETDGTVYRLGVRQLCESKNTTTSFLNWRYKGQIPTKSHDDENAQRLHWPTACPSSGWVLMQSFFGWHSEAGIKHIRNAGWAGQMRSKVDNGKLIPVWHSANGVIKLVFMVAWNRVVEMLRAKTGIDKIAL